MSPDTVDTASVTWRVDPLSGKACPSSTAEWTDFLAASSLPIAAPDGLWLFQDATAPLPDSVGTVALSAFGAPTFQQAVTGWSRVAVKSADGTAQRFSNTTDQTLPNVGTTSMTVLMMYATVTRPFLIQRAVLYAGCCQPTTYAEVDVDVANHLKLTIDTTTVTGTVDHGTGVIPVVMKLDQTHQEQRLITSQETLALPYTALGSSRGVFIGGASYGSPDGRWLYMAAWYGTGAEMTDANISKLITALGW